MKQLLVLLYVTLVCTLPASAFHRDLGQDYQGGARPRAETTWIWIGEKVSVDGIDGYKICTPISPSEILSMSVVEVLPGMHIFSLRYNNGNGRSGEDQDVQIEARAGEDYMIVGAPELEKRRDSSGWNTTLTAYSPSTKEIGDLKRVLLERSVSVEGVVRSWEQKRQDLILTVSGDLQAREFRCKFSLRTGQKIKVSYFPSRPDEVVDVNIIE